MTAEQIKDRIIRRANERLRVVSPSLKFNERDHDAPFLHSLVEAIAEAMLELVQPVTTIRGHEDDCRCEWCKVHA